MKKILSLFALLMTIVIGAKAEDVEVTYALAKDDAFTSGQSVNVQNSSSETVATITYGESGGADFKAAKSDSQVSGFSAYTEGNGTNGNKSGGTFYTIVPVYDGTIDIAVQLNADKAFHINEDGTDMEGYAGIKVDEKYYGTYTFTVKAGSSYKVWCDGSKLGFYGFNYTYSDGNTPTITTQPQNAEYVIGSTTYPSMTVEAEASEGTLSYQWELSYDGENFDEIGKLLVPSAVTSTLLGSEAIALLPEQAATYYLRCKVTDSNGSVYTDVATLNVIADAPTITTDLEAAYNVIKGQTQELSIVAEGASSYQWYLDGEAVEGATTDTYTFTAGSTIGATNAVYCAAINAAGATNSATATITTVGRADCELTNIQFSNGAYGAINSAKYGAGTIAVPYMAGTEAPTVEEASINVSDGATYVLDGNTLTVTAEDETTSKEFTINAVEITPLDVTADVAKTEFTAVPSWVFNLYGFGENKSDTDYKGVKFAKAVNDATMRIALGNTRQYWFIGAAKSITLTSGTGGERNIKVYRNGVQLSEPTKTAKKNEDITIALDETAPCMIMIESNQTGGDGGFTFYAIEAAASPIEVTLGANGYSTYCGDENFTVTSGAKAYTATLSGSTVTLNEVAAGTVIGKGTGIVLVGTQGEKAVLTPTTEAAASMELGNNLVGVNAETTSIEANAYVLASNDTKTSFVKAGAYGNVTDLMNKAYIVYSGSLNSLDIQFEGEATAINNVNANDNADSAAPVKVIKNGKLFIGNYNVAGQLVK